LLGLWDLGNLLSLPQSSVRCTKYLERYGLRNKTCGIYPFIDSCILVFFINLIDQFFFFCACFMIIRLLAGHAKFRFEIIKNSPNHLGIVNNVSSEFLDRYFVLMFHNEMCISCFYCWNIYFQRLSWLFAKTILKC